MILNGKTKEKKDESWKPRVSRLEGKMDAVLGLTIVEFIGFVGLVITLINKL